MRHGSAATTSAVRQWPSPLLLFGLRDPSWRELVPPLSEGSQLPDDPALIERILSTGS